MDKLYIINLRTRKAKGTLEYIVAELKRKKKSHSLELLHYNSQRDEDSEIT